MITLKEVRQEEKRIRTIMVHWKNVIGLTEWTLKSNFSIIPINTDDSNHPTADCIGKAEVMWEYKQADLTFDVTKTQGLSELELEEAVLHEMVHAVVNEMREWSGREDTEDIDDLLIKHEERVVTSITTALLAAQEIGYKLATRALKATKALNHTSK